MFRSYQKSSSRGSSIRSNRRNIGMSIGNPGQRGMSRDYKTHNRKLNNTQNHNSSVALDKVNSLSKVNSSFMEENKLPVLGLRKYMIDTSFDPNKPINPFNVNRNTEKLLMNRERERLKERVMREHRKGAKVHQKTIAGRTNRAGVIRQINMVGTNSTTSQDNKDIRENFRDFK